MVEEGSKKILDGIHKSLASDTGFLVGRFGTIEFETCWEITRDKRPLEQDMRIVLEMNAGVFPSSIESIQNWVSMTKEAFHSADILATGWYPPIVKKELKLLEEWGSTAEHILLRSLEPYYSKDEYRWSNGLSGQKVCVVSSFADTIQKQIAKGEKSVWPTSNETIWPSSTKWSYVNTGYSPAMSRGKASWHESPSSWKEAVTYVVQRVMETDARIVLIGCGGLGMIIGHELKRRGKICIVMGGAIQVFFGIKGGRWKSHEFISKLWNEEWVYPSDKETPGACSAVENSCYWKPL